MKKKALILLALLLAASVLAGCTNNSSMDTKAAVVPETTPAGYAAEAPQTYDTEMFRSATDGVLTADTVAAAQKPADRGRKLIKTVWMEAETEDFDALLTGIDQQITALRGYVESREVYSGSAYQGTSSRSADMTIRIPVNKLEEFVSQVEGIANVVSTSETTEDVTLSYTDTKSRQTALETERDRLLELMEQAGTMEELLEIEARLTDVRYQLESSASQLRLYDSLISYSTVNLSVSEVEVLTPVAELSNWEKITTGLRSNMSSMAKGVTEFLIALVVSLPFWIPVVVIAVPAYLLVRRANRKAKAKQEEAAGQTPEEKSN